MRKMRKILGFLIILTFAALVSNAQKLSQIRISEISLWQGIQSYDFQSMSDETFNQFVPSAILEPDNIEEFTSSSFYIGTPLQSNYVGINAGFKFLDGEKQQYRANPILKLGFIYGTTTLFTSSQQNSEFTPLDTLSSSTSDEVIYKGLETNFDYYRSYQFEQFGINSELLYRYNPNGRWSLIGGFAFKTLFSGNTHTTELFTQSTNKLYKFDSGGTINGGYYNGSDSFNIEEHQNKSNIHMFVSIPLGVDFRIAKKNQFWNKIHLWVDFQPGLNIFIIPETETMAFGKVLINSGIRVDIR